MELEKKVKKDVKTIENQKNALVKDLMIKNADVFTPCLKTKSVVIVNSTSEVNSIISESTNISSVT